MRVNDSVRIRFEDQNVIIDVRRIVRSGKNEGAEAWDALGYHGTLASAARSLIERHVDLLVEDPETVKDVRALVAAANRAAEVVARAVAR